MKPRIALAAVAVAVALATPTGAAGDDDDDENESVTRVACVGGAAELRLGEGDDDDDGGGIAIELRVRVAQPVLVWRLVLLHERRIVYQGLRASSRSGHYLRYSRSVPDWHGRQTVIARLATPSGRACRLEVTI